MNITNNLSSYTINVAQYTKGFIFENGSRFIKYIPDAIYFAKEGDIGGLAHRSFELLTSFDTPVYGAITLLALYQMGFFGSAREKLRGAMYGGFPPLFKLAFLLRMVKVEDAIAWNIACNNPESLKSVLDAFSPPFSHNELNKCFHWASRAGSLQVLQMLLQKGASLEAKDEFNRTPIVIAAYHAGKDAVQFLYESGADHLKVDHVGRSVLHWVCVGISRDQINKSILPYLLSLPRIREIINQKDMDGNTPLYYLNDEVEELRDLMIKNGADCTVSNNEGATLLDTTCCIGEMGDIIYYARRGLNFHLSQSASFLNESLVFRAMYENERILPLIDEKVLSLFYVDSSTKDSLFHFAARDGSVDLLKGLLARLPKLNAINFLMQREVGSRTASGHLRVSSMRNKEGKTVFLESIEIAKHVPEKRVQALEVIKVLLEASIQPDREALEAARGDAELEKLFGLKPSVQA